MLFPTPLVPGTLIRRYKRFLADVLLDSGDTVVSHCPNTGAMTGLDAPGIRVWLEPNDDPRKKLDYGWRLSELPDGHWVGIDSMVPNRVMGAALRAGEVEALAAYSTIKPEVNYGKSSRIDFFLSEPGLQDAYVEIKNVHLSREAGWAEFPDATTERGARHLDELADMARLGHRAVMFYFVQRTDCTRFRLADDVDARYASAFKNARDAGVEVLCYDTEISTNGVRLRNQLSVEI